MHTSIHLQVLSHPTILVSDDGLSTAVSLIKCFCCGMLEVCRIIFRRSLAFLTLHALYEFLKPGGEKRREPAQDSGQAEKGEKQLRWEMLNMEYETELWRECEKAHSPTHFNPV